jgi:hypothetical protein
MAGPFPGGTSRDSAPDAFMTGAAPKRILKGSENVLFGLENRQ